ncbi:MAG: DUF3662 domain-containing protein [Chloroflexi bacterium]|jgi:hypothetical protein|nr:DUF3662 domain-containing protein [Chloroflexota bacterium]
MSAIVKTLNQIEARLQTLIEGKIAGLFPAQFDKAKLIDELMAALQTGIIEQQGVLTAPDIFHIRTHPQHSLQQIAPEPVTREMSDVLSQAAEQAGVAFRHPPIVDLVQLVNLETEGIEIITAFRGETVGETHAIQVEPEESVENAPPNAFLIVNGSQIFTLDKSVINIGRRNENDLVIDDPRVSRNHAQLRATRGRYTIFDLDSTGGTLVNGNPISQSELFPRDVISIAGVPLVYAQDEVIDTGTTQEYLPKPATDDEHPTRGAIL